MLTKTSHMINNRAIAIVRVSTAEQAHEERYSIPHQKTHIMEECRHRNYDLVHIFEFVQSGSTVLSSKSKEKESVINYIKDYSICIVLVHELDRLSRSMLDTLLFVDELSKLEVSFVSIHDTFDTTTAQGQLQMSILSAFSEYFRKQLASKVLGGMMERAKEGRHMGRRPFGYGLGDLRFVIIPEEARIVKKIFDMYLNENMGLRAIAEWLNSAGIKTLRGLIWSHQTTKDILENEVYTGTFIWGDIRVENNHEPIIPRETWEKAQLRRRRKREMGGRAQNSFYLLSGLLRCKVCSGAPMVGRYARKGKWEYRYYTCNNYASRGTGTCPSKYVRSDQLESIVMDAIKKLALSSEDIDLKQDLIPADIDILKEELAFKERELDRLKVALVRAAEAYERGDYELDFFSQRQDSITRHRKSVEGEIANLRERIKGQLSPAELERRVHERQRNARAVMEENDPIKIKAILQVLIDRIEVRDIDDFTIFYRG